MYENMGRVAPYSDIRVRGACARWLKPAARMPTASGCPGSHRGTFRALDSTELSIHQRLDPRPEQFDRSKEGRMGQAADIHLQELAHVPDAPLERDDSLGDFLRT